MNILLIGSGGREHALAWKMNDSSLLEDLYISPGNAGTSTLGKNVSLDVENHLSVVEFCQKKNIDIVVIGPEQPLVDGLTDTLQKHKIGVIGPTGLGARLEGSKDFAKVFMQNHNIPTAAYQTFKTDQIEEAQNYIDTMETPIVLKADGLAAGKGVLICPDHTSAKTEIAAMLKGKFGSASNSVVIEEFLDGIEFSVFALTDGENYVLLPSAKDYKRALDGDKGLNTGGMGTASPVPFIDDALMVKVKSQIVEPTIQGLSKDGIDYSGFIFFGLIKVGDNPFVIEYNCRLGDPETQVILPRLEDDLILLFQKTISKELGTVQTHFSTQHVVSVVLASGGYPESYDKGKVIHLIQREDQLLFHAGTTIKDEKLVTNGGRVMACCGKANQLEEAIQKAYNLANSVSFEKKYFRKDIGQDLLKYVSR